MLKLFDELMNKVSIVLIYASIFSYHLKLKQGMQNAI